jgi:ring-1,2-phenylacetyl-CoA epoxidase subunit PaaE
VVPAAQIDHVYVCGPFQMNDEAEAALLAAGVPEDRIHIERFGVACPPVRRRHPGRRGGARGVAGRRQAGAHHHRARRPASARSPSPKASPASWTAASAAGLEVPFSCTSGVCGTCRAKCVDGEVRMERNFALDKNEVAAGFVLTCQAHPITERVTLSFDER